MNGSPQRQASLFSVRMIWDKAPHNAFSDLVYFNKKWFCAFREGNVPPGGQENGQIQLIGSEDGINWLSMAVFKETGVDFLDPKLSVTPDGELMLVFCALTAKKQGVERQSFSCFSQNGKKFGPKIVALEPNCSLWRVSWHLGKAYGVAYQDSLIESHAGLYGSDDGKKFTLITPFHLNGIPTETTLRFLPTGDMIALVRRNRVGDNHCLIGISHPPYTIWRWNILNYFLGGPNFVILPNSTYWAAGNFITHSPYARFDRTVLFSGKADRLITSLILPSGGETGYPGMVYRDGVLWMSYHSSHQGKTAIYLAQILLS